MELNVPLLANFGITKKVELTPVELVISIYLNRIQSLNLELDGQVSINQ
ncbi:UNVERIFIED_CONTAM: hypothetical protein GTU68_050674 [Idotea baltica]|nr:hypothetical protein [Idotea baltica]